MKSVRRGHLFFRKVDIFSDFSAGLPRNSNRFRPRFNGSPLMVELLLPGSVPTARLGCGTDMRIGVNARRLEGQRLGVGRYIEYLLKHWDRMLGPEERVVLYVRSPFQRDELGLSERFAVELLEPRLTGISWETAHLRRQASAIDVLFCPNYSVPFRYPGRCVVATHSVNEIQPGAHGSLYSATYSRLYRYSARRADRVIVPAASTLRDVAAMYAIPESKLSVVEQGADDAFRPVEDQAAARATRERLFGHDVPYVLFVGKLSARRNIPALIQAFGRLKARGAFPHKLLLLGPNHHDLPLDNLIAAANVSADVVQTDGRFASHEEIIPIYNAADVFVHPSVYEGFSMTTVEALACGVPVIAANRGGLGDIANGYARMVENPDPATLSAAMEEVLSSAPLRAELRRKSRERGATFRWENTARKTLDVLRQVAAD